MDFSKKEYYLAAKMYNVYMVNLEVMQRVPFARLTNQEQMSWVMVLRLTRDF